MEDCAQAFGTWRRTGDGIVRCGGWGGLGAFSFFPTKNLGCYGDGGMVSSNCDALAERLSRLRVHGAGTTYYHDEVGLNSRLDAIQAAVLRVHLRHLDQWIEERRLVADRYRLFFAERDLAEFVTPPMRHPELSSYHQYDPRHDATALMDFLAAEGITSRSTTSAVHLRGACFLAAKWALSESERLLRNAWLCHFPRMTRKSSGGGRQYREIHKK